jgi:hypothetical protein
MPTQSQEEGHAEDSEPAKQELYCPHLNVQLQGLENAVTIGRQPIAWATELKLVWLANEAHLWQITQCIIADYSTNSLRHDPDLQT